MIRNADFKPHPWLRGPHLQTLWAALLRRRSRPNVSRERLELEDGDFLDLSWMPVSPGPVVLVLHGLEGSLRSPYAANLLTTLHARGYHPVLMHFRGCSGEPNRLPRRYHFGDTGDLDLVRRHIRTRFADKPLAMVGFSLGGNVLLKWLGETGNATDVAGAVAVSVPFNLHDAADRLNIGLSQIYQYHLLRKLKASVRSKQTLLTPHVDIKKVLRSRSFWEFDDWLTAPLHGFRDVDDYYTRATSLPYLQKIETPTLVLHARDDPFMLPQNVPDETALSKSTLLELSDAGGHVGFVSTLANGTPNYWLQERILRYLDTIFQRIDVAQAASRR